MSINPANITTIRVDQLAPDSILLTDIFPFETLADQTLKKATFQDLVNFMNIHSAALQFEIKEMAVNQTYIDNNFDITGLGINLCTGFAICNGQNGTPNLDGLTTIAFGSTYTNIGGFGGSKDAVVVEHIHVSTITKSVNTSGGAGTSLVCNTLNNAGTQDINTTTAGISGNNKNMQPYVVHLKMMKL